MLISPGVCSRRNFVSVGLRTIGNPVQMSDSSTEPLDSPTQFDPLQVALVACLAMAVMSLGGFASGLAIAKFGTLGTASLWLVGEVAGAAGRKLLPEKNYGGKVDWT